MDVGSLATQTPLFRRPITFEITSVMFKHFEEHFLHEKETD